MMLNINNPTCKNCPFSLFCDVFDKQYLCSNQVNCVVKQYVQLKKRDLLYNSRNVFRSIYVIQSGNIKTYQVDAQGNELIQGFYFSGELIGLDAIYTQSYRFSAIALTDVVLCEIPYDNFIEFIQTHPLLQKHILYLMSQQLNVGAYLFSNMAEQRLAAFLIDLCHRLSPSKMQTTFVLPMSRQDIGNYLRLTAETISRILSQFKKDKLIAIDHKNIQLLQFDTLKTIAAAGSGNLTFL